MEESGQEKIASTCSYMFPKDAFEEDREAGGTSGDLTDWTWGCPMQVAMACLQARLHWPGEGRMLKALWKSAWGSPEAAQLWSIPLSTEKAKIETA